MSHVKWCVCEIEYNIEILFMYMSYSIIYVLINSSVYFSMIIILL